MVKRSVRHATRTTATRHPAFPAATATQTSERIVRKDGVEIVTEAFGNPAHPPVLLVMGAMASMLWWPEAFCERLAARGRYVIRYDNRDTGLSTTYAPGEPGYTSDDLVDDTVRILDGYGISAAHLVGMSMGGAIAQLAALKYPDRIMSLTAISTSPVGVDTSGLPGASEAYMKHAAEGAHVDWSDRAEVIDFMVRDSRAIAGTAYPHDEVEARRLVERDVNRARNFASATNHFQLKSNDERHVRLSEIHAPLLVIHGTADPLFPVEHGAALADAVPGAKLVTLEGGGHELHKGHWDRIITAITEHTEPWQGTATR